MERIIKFRAWDKLGNKMYEDTKHSMSADTELGLNEIIARTQKCDYELMQFTGLVDKECVELFESDIVQVRSFLGEIMGTYVLEYKLNAFNYYAPGKPEQALYFAQNLVEKIGNIYENKELLDQPQQ